MEEVCASLNHIMMLCSPGKWMHTKHDVLCGSYFRPAQVSGKLELGTWRESRLASFNLQGFQFLGEIYNVDAVIKELRVAERIYI